MKKVAVSDDDTLPARVVVSSSHGHVLFGAPLPFGPDDEAGTEFKQQSAQTVIILLPLTVCLI